MPATPTIDAILLLYHREPRRDADTVQENIDAFAAHSAFPVVSLNTDLGMPRALAGMRFRIVVLHYSLFAPSYHLSAPLRRWLHASRPDHLVAIFQDEYHHCRQRFAFLNEYAVDCVYTQLEPEHVDAVYGAHTDVGEVVSHIPGYVSERLLADARQFARPLDDRPLDLGYRGRRLPFYMGRGSQEKHEIGVRFAEHAAASGLRIDISSREEDRIYGEAWSEFLGSCKATLGTESGVSIFDLDDSVRAAYERCMSERPDMTFDDFERAAGTSDLEERIPYRTISPRHFEAAAFRTLQIMYPGRYSGMMEAGKHYLPLEKDFSNVGEVIDQLRDDDLRAEVTEAAHRDLIESGEHTYERFMRGFDGRLVDAGFSPAEDRTEAERAARALRSDIVRRQAVRRLRYASYRQFPGRAHVVRVVKPILRRSDGVPLA